MPSVKSKRITGRISTIRKKVSIDTQDRNAKNAGTLYLRINKTRDISTYTPTSIGNVTVSMLIRIIEKNALSAKVRNHMCRAIIRALFIFQYRFVYHYSEECAVMGLYTKYPTVKEFKKLELKSMYRYITRLMEAADKERKRLDEIHYR